MDTIVYDLEISKTIEEAGGWTNYDNMGLGSAVAYSFKQDKYFFYLHDSDKQKLIDLLNGNRIITYNGVSFDSHVLLGEDREIEKTNGVGIMVYNKSRTVKWLEYDIYLQILKAQYNLDNDFSAIGKFPKGGRGGLKLGGVTQATLGVEQCKTAPSGAEAPKMYKAKDYSTLLEYNLQDTILTRKLYDFIHGNSFIKNAFGKRIDLIDTRRPA